MSEAKEVSVSDFFRHVEDWINHAVEKGGASPAGAACMFETTRHMRELIERQQAEIERKDEALRAILADPHGCRFCDSGKLRKPAKDHDPGCGYALARIALASPTEEPK